MSNSKDENVILLADPSSGPPPKTDMYFSERAMIRSGLIDTVRFAIAVGLGWAFMFIIISIVGVIGGGRLLDFSILIYPNFNTSVILAVIIGFALSFLYAFIFAIIVGVLYNSLVRRQLIEQESWETYS
jgi:Zn-dependent protease with chaperone function